jgi:hypothetical protein
MDRLMGRCCRIVVILLAVLGAAASSSATTIGVFAYDLDDTFGPVFRVENDSTNLLPGGSTFANLAIHLRQDGKGGDVAELLLGDLLASDSTMTFDDLSLFAFDSAVLSFDFSVPGTLDLSTLGLTGIAASTVHLTSFIDFDAPVDPSPVPEPATLVLTSAGAALALAKRRRYRRR